MSKRWKSLFFYGQISLLAAISLAAGWLAFGREESSPCKGEVFDKNQYLFANEGAIVSFKSFDVNVVENGFFAAGGPPFLVAGKVLGSFGAPEQGQKTVDKYIVQEGDTLAGLAGKFNISLETILWANNLSYQSVISPGQELVILPVSGIMHIAGPGDTLSEITELYRAKLQKIIEVNNLSNPGDIYVGDILIVPDGKKPKAEASNYVQVPLSNSYFICPLPSPCQITQALHWFNAVDFSNGRCGEAVFAAAGGTVQRTGRESVSGNYVRIIHPNGVVTFYGHLSKFTVKPGAPVRQGEIIGYVGSTGITVPAGPAGCHLHFDVRFSKNPFAAYTVGTKLGK